MAAFQEDLVYFAEFVVCIGDQIQVSPEAASNSKGKLLSLCGLVGELSVT